MNDWMIWAAQLGITLLLGALSWFVKRSFDQQHDREQQQEDRIKEVDDKVNAMRNYLSDEFVKKSASWTASLKKCCASRANKGGWLNGSYQSGWQQAAAR